MRSNLWMVFILLQLVILKPIFTTAASFQRIDSLETALNTATASQKLEIYNELIKNLRNLDPLRGIEHSRKAIPLADSLNNNIVRASLINEAGVCYRKLNIYEKALELHFEALRIFERENDSMGVAFSYANIGMVYYFFHDYPNALDYHFRSLLIKEYLGDKTQIAYSQNSIGMVLVEMGDYARALDYYISALAVQIKIGKRTELANIYGNLSKVLSKLGRWNEALDYFKQAEDVFIQIGSDYGRALTLNEIGGIYNALKQYDNALETLKTAEIIGLKYNNAAILHFNYKMQAGIYNTLNNHKMAYDYLLKSANLKDTLFSEQRNREMADIQVRYEISRLDAENEILHLRLAEQQLRIRFLIVLIVSSILIFMIFFFIWRQVKNKKVENQLKKLNASLEVRVTERTRELEKENIEKQIALVSLGESEEKFRAISEASPVGIAVTNHTGKIIFTNNNLVQQTGIEEKLFLSGSWFTKIIIEDRPKVEALWKSSHDRQPGTFEVDFRFRNQNNEIVWIHLTASPMVLSGVFIGMVSLMENITAQKRFEQELIKSKNKAEESDKLKSAFLANMSHEIRTPMNAILGFTDLLNSDDYNDEEKGEFVQLIKSSGKLLLNLINDIIDISKIEAGELKIQHSLFKPAELMYELYQAGRQQLDSNGKEHIQLMLEQPEDAGDIVLHTDRLRLHQIVSNLLNNATKFTDQGYVHFGFIRVDGKLQFFVKDSGIGIHESKLEIVFERFRQADETHSRLFGGTGLGLAIVKSLVDLLKGQIWVESIHGKGTIFYFTLDLPAEDQLNTKPRRTYPDFSGKTILIAEDNEASYLLLKRLLLNTNASILYAENGLIAVDMAASAPAPDLILMDIQMPEMSGIEALKKIRTLGISTPAVAITAFALLDEEKVFVRKGFDAYLSKPIGLENLLEKLSAFLR